MFIKEAMNGYSEFEEGSLHNQTANIEPPAHDVEQIVCVKNFISKPNPLMNKIQFVPYEPRNFYPANLVKLPHCLANDSLYTDRNNMLLMEDALYGHQKLKKDVAKCILKNNQKKTVSHELLSIRQYYQNKSLIYQKFAPSDKSQYLATFVLSIGAVAKQQKEKMGTSGFIIRNSKTPNLTERGKNERLSFLLHRPSIDFNSNFQSGNLFRAYHKQVNQYDLILQNDINTKGNNQWFFFSVKSVPKGATVKFNIVNMSKRFSLFQYGMKPAVFSMIRHEKRNIGWVREGSKLNYSESQYLKKQSGEQPYYCLSFQYKFFYEGDIVYFSYSIPYTFSCLCKFLTNSLAHRNHSKLVKLKSLGSTLGGNQITLFDLTNHQVKSKKKSVWILSRQHSGEVTSSFMMEGIFNFLLSGTPEANSLLDNYLFRIVPMVNVDGVFHGNTRAQLIGSDPNRKWVDPHKIYNPIIYSIKKMIERDSQNVQMVLDLHSHSRKLGTFFYGNSFSKNRNITKVFPMMVCKNDERFDYRSNRFIGGNKETARNVLFQNLKIPLIYTVESSFYGYQRENDFKITPYATKDYRQMGQTILKTFYEFTQKRKSQITDERLYLIEPHELQNQQNLWNKMNDLDDVQSIGSDEDPGEDQFSKSQMQQLLPKNEKKKKKNAKKNKKMVNVKEQKQKKQQKVKEEEVKLRKIDKDSYYKKYFTGRCSLKNPQQIQENPKIRRYLQTKNLGVQVDIAQPSVLHRSSFSNMMSQRKTIIQQKFSQQKTLCVIGQKLQEQITINGPNIGIQTELSKQFLKNRYEVLGQNQSNIRRSFRSNPKVGTLLQVNQNNFLNRGDFLHSGVKIMSKK